MKYQIDTIPVWEALEYQGPCLLCTLRAKTEAGEIERVLGASVMEPDVRVHTNEIGVCRDHQQMMFATQNRLAHALLMDTRAMEVQAKLEKIKKEASKEVPARGFGGRKPHNSLADKLRDLNANCAVCENINAHMERYIYTVLYLWKSDPKFKRQLLESKGLCIPHAADLIEAADKQLSAKERAEFTQACLGLLCDHLAEDEKDLNWFTLKFDYRNQDKPWGNSKNATERTVNRLRGYCVGDIPFVKPKK